jgi:Na+/H+ antiporter NhaD/arsenite permease-like protein
MDQETIAVLIFSIAYAGIAFGSFPGLKIDRTGIALLGAIGMLAAGVLTETEAFNAIDLPTILLLYSLMVLSAQFTLAGVYTRIALSITTFTERPAFFLFVLMAASAVLSAVVVNDIVCFAFTPVVCVALLRASLNPAPFLIGLACASNIGSAATIIGNPQNMLIGIASAIPFNHFTAYLAPVALSGLAIIWIVLVVTYGTEFAAGQRLEKEPHASFQTEPALLRKSMIATGAMLAALVLGMPIPLAALAAAALLLISRRTDPELVFREVDWSLLVFFAGLFIVTHSLETLGVGARMLEAAQPLAESSITALTVVAAVLSNLVSNVPAVLLLRPIVPSFPDPSQTWLTLAMATTLAGNLTLLGSVANLIVAEIAARRGVELGFNEYLRSGAAITLLSLAAGVAWLSQAF